MTAFCSSSFCWSPLLSHPVSRHAGVAGRSYRCSYGTQRDDPCFAVSAPQSAKSVASSMLASVAACLVVTASCAPAAEAGLLSGSPGLESIQLPSLPTPEFLKKTQEDSKARYEELDAKFKSSSYLRELLKRSQLNAEKHKLEIQNKYCQRGADWGVGDCSVAAMSEEERSSFKEALKGNEVPQ